MTAELIDTREMLAIHEAFRKEFAALPLRVKSVPENDADRAAVIAGHVSMMIMMLEGHHAAEDTLLWPVLLDRAPDSTPLVEMMETQHELLTDMIESINAEVEAWTSDTNIETRSTLHTSLIALERALLEHLSLEEKDAMPLVAANLSEEEFAAIGNHARATLTPEQLAIGLGVILDDNSAEMGEVILSAMPADARAAFEQFGRPAYREYRDRLNDDA